jgi:hypothetical protein
MSAKSVLVAVVALVVGVVIGAAVQTAKPNLAGVTVENETFLSDVSVANDLTVGKDLILTDNDFCIQLYATSTATAVKMVASTTVASGSNIGVFTMQYGSCVE